MAARLQPAASQAATIPTLVVSTEELAARQAARPIETPSPSSARDKLDIPIGKRRSPLMFVGALVVGFLILVGAGGYAFMKFKGTSTSATTPSRWIGFDRVRCTRSRDTGSKSRKLP